MTIVSLKNISKSYGIDVILKDINLTLNENEKAGLVGINGAGKSTLFKILYGQIKPDSGEIYIMKDKKIGYLSQSLDLDEDETIFKEVMKVFKEIKDMEKRLHELEKLIADPKNIKDEDYHNKLLSEYGYLQEEYERRNGYSCESYAKGVLIGLGVLEEDFNKEIKYLSGGQKTRVALSKMLLSSPDILLLDEPTNHLDLSALSYLENFLKDYSGTILIISHDRYFLDQITTKTFELKDGMIEEYDGNYSFYISERRKRTEQRTKEYDLQQTEIKRLEGIIEKYRSFNREKSIKQAESREKQLSKIERIDKPSSLEKAAKISFDIDYKSGNDVIVVENLSKSFGENHLFSNLSFLIRRGERTALIGDNGKGKSTLFKILCGEIEKDSGFFKIGKNVKIGYYDQEQKNLSPDKTVIDEIWDEYPDMTVTGVRNALAAFLFTGDDVFKNVSALSGGEKCRLSLLKVMLSRSNLLLLDEPTNHLDILSREALEDALLEYKGTLFVISHDRYFLNKVINRIFELSKDTLTEYKGNYSYYVQKKNAKEDEIVVATDGKTKTEIKEERKKLREEKEKQKALNNTIKEVEKSIEEKEETLSKLENMMCLEEVYSNPEKAQEVAHNVNEVKNEIEKLYTKWEELSS
jgi:ATP-binding cassette subfamily F protein 3